MRLPILYRDTLESSRSMFRLFGQSSVYAIGEAVYIWAATSVTLKSLTINSSNLSQAIISEIFLLIHSGLHLIRIISFKSEITKSFKLLLCLVVVLIYAVLLPLRSQDDASNGLDFYRGLVSNWRIIVVFLVTMSVPAVL